MPKQVDFVGEQIKAMRKRAGLSQTSLAQSIGVTKQAVSAYESGVANPSTATLQKLAEALGTDVAGLIQGTNTALPSESNARLVGSWDEQDFLDLPFVTYAAYGTFAQNCLDPQPEAFTTTRIIKMPGHNYKEAAVIEVKGNSMAPKYPERARFVIRPVSNGNWQHSQGVHAIALKSHMFIIKRITSNREGVLELTSDATGEKMEVSIGEINCMWKVGEAVYFPAED